MMHVETAVFELIATESGTRQERVSLASTLLGDLGIDGDDAWEVLEGLHRKFGVDFSELEPKRGQTTFYWHLMVKTAVCLLFYSA